MTIYIVDTNVIFSAALRGDSGLAQFIFSAKEHGVKMYAPSFLVDEIAKHKPKLLAVSKMTDAEVDLALQRLYEQITFVEDRLVPMKDFATAARLIADIDPDDLAFVALSINMDEMLWTGDKKLHQALLRKGYHKVISFEEIKELYNIP